MTQSNSIKWLLIILCFIGYYSLPESIKGPVVHVLFISVVLGVADPYAKE